MLHWVVPAGLKYVVETYHVGLYVGVGVRDGVPHAGLCGKVHHYVEPVLLEETVYEAFVGYVPLYEGEVPVQGFKLLEPVFLERDVVVVVHVVQTHYGIVRRGYELLCKVRSNEACGSRYKYRPFHFVGSPFCVSFSVPSEKVPCEHLVLDVCKVCVESVCYYDVAHGLELIEVVDDL